MDRALILVLIAAVQRERLLIRLSERDAMASAIQDKLAKLRTARQQMIDDLSSELDSVTAQVLAARDDGLEAMKLPRAEISATKQLIVDIRAEFAPQTNGGPAGPLPGAPRGSPVPSANSAALQPDAEDAAQKNSNVTALMGNWKPMNEAPRADVDGKPVPIRLFLPSAKFHIDEAGRPVDVSDVETVGVFDAALQHWVEPTTGAKVYPSQWQPL